jgi:hypothetical protein
MCQERLEGCVAESKVNLATWAPLGLAFRRKRGPSDGDGKFKRRRTINASAHFVQPLHSTLTRGGIFSLQIARKNTYADSAVRRLPGYTEQKRLSIELIRAK